MMRDRYRGVVRRKAKRWPIECALWWMAVHPYVCDTWVTANNERVDRLAYGRRAALGHRLLSERGE